MSERMTATDNQTTLRGVLRRTMTGAPPHTHTLLRANLAAAASLVRGIIIIAEQHDVPPGPLLGIQHALGSVTNLGGQAGPKHDVHPTLVRLESFCAELLDLVAPRLCRQVAENAYAVCRALSTIKLVLERPIPPPSAEETSLDFIIDEFDFLASHITYMLSEESS